MEYLEIFNAYKVYGVTDHDITINSIELYLYNYAVAAADGPIENPPSHSVKNASIAPAAVQRGPSARTCRPSIPPKAAELAGCARRASRRQP